MSLCSVATMSAGSAYKALNSILPDPIPGLSGLKFYVNGKITPPTNIAGVVSAWTDLSGQGNTLNSVSTPAPTTVDAGVGVHCLKASSQWIERSGVNIIGTGAFCMIAVLKVLDTTSGTVYVCNADLATGGVTLQSTSGKWDASFYASGGNPTTTNIDTTTHHVVIIDRPAASNPVFYLDGASQAFSSNTNTIVNAAGGACVTIGAYGTSGGRAGFSSCDVDVFAICNAAQGATNVALIQAYLKQQFGTP